MHLYKVGITCDLTSRMSVYNTCAPEDFTVIFYKFTEDNNLIEKIVRIEFGDYLYAYNKEWYKFEFGVGTLIDFIEECIQDLFQG